MNIKTQTPKDGFWIDEKGTSIPYNRITKIERLKEKGTAKLLKDSISINKRLLEHKSEVRRICDEIHAEAMAEGNIENASKGNHTVFNFDRSIRIDVSISERIEFDDLDIKVCKEKLYLYIDENVTAKDDFIKQIITDAFSTQNGKLDAKKVMGLLRYKSKVKSPLFTEAIEFLERSIRRPSSKTYFRISVKEDDGSYKVIDLNFSSI